MRRLEPSLEREVRRQFPPLPPPTPSPQNPVTPLVLTHHRAPLPACSGDRGLFSTESKCEKLRILEATHSEELNVAPGKKLKKLKGLNKSLQSELSPSFLHCTLNTSIQVYTSLWIQPVHPKDQSWVFIGRTDVEAETPILWPPHAKS